MKLYTENSEIQHGINIYNISLLIHTLLIHSFVVWQKGMDLGEYDCWNFPPQDAEMQISTCVMWSRPCRTLFIGLTFKRRDWPDGEVAITLEVILRVSCSIQDRVANIIVQQFCIYIFNLGAKEAVLW